MGMGFQFEQHRLGLWDLSWGLKKNNFLGNNARTTCALHFIDSDACVHKPGDNHDFNCHAKI